MPSSHIDIQFGNFSMGIDLGSTITGLSICQWNGVDRKVYTIYSDELTENPEYNKVFAIIKNNIQIFSPDKIYVDASNSFLVRDLQNMFREEPFEIIKRRIEQEYKDPGMKTQPYETAEKYMRIIPIPWNKEGSNMMLHSKYLMETDKVRINPCFEKLINALQTAHSSNDKLDKELTIHNDVYDSFILALRRYRK